MGRVKNSGRLKACRRKLRRHLTPAEATLWSALKKSNLAGRKFRRQHSVGRYVLDFYCPKENVAVELDGDSHRYSGDLDSERDSYLESLGIEVVRIENKNVFEDMAGVLDLIRSRFGDS